MADHESGGSSSSSRREPLSRDDLLRIVRRAEDGIRPDRVETLIAFDRFGQEILRKQGRHDSVTIAPDEQRRLQGATITHNHPHGWTFPPDEPRHAGSSFSLKDVFLAIAVGAAEMRVVTPVWRYSVRPGPGQRWTQEFFRQVIEPAYQQADGDVRDDFMAAVRARRMTMVQIMAEHFHEIWTRVARQTGVHYEREAP